MSSIKDTSFIPLINDLITRDETDSLEFKRMLKKPGDLIDSIVSLANTKGGLLVLGMEDYGKAKGFDRLIGISEGNHNYAEFLTLLVRNIQPPVTYELNEIDIVNTKGKDDKIVIVKINASSDIYSTTGGDTLIRKDKSNRKIGSQEIIRLMYEKGTLKYENETSGIRDLSELDNEIFNEFKKSIRAHGDDWQILKDNGLAIHDDLGRQLTKGGVLLFGKNPDILLGTKSSIRISHYKGVNPNFSDEPNFVRRPFSIEGPLRTQISKCMDFYEELSQFFPTALQANGGFESSLMIPRFVFQEAITNAVIHRNYSVMNDIQIRIFDNRIEIESPGIYPGVITPANIMNERYPRNPLILKTLSRFDSAPNLDIGEGVDRMFQLMEYKGLFDPLYSTIDEKPYSVQVTLLNIKKPSYWNSLKKYLLQKGYIVSKELKDLIGENNVQNIQGLVDLKILVTEGNAEDYVYRLSGTNIL